MPRYFFQVHDGADYPDDYGADLYDLEAAQKFAIVHAGQVLQCCATDLWAGESWVLDVTDDKGVTLLTLSVFGTRSSAATGDRNADAIHV